MSFIRWSKQRMFKRILLLLALITQIHNVVAQEQNEELIILPLGINLGERNVNESVMVRGAEDGENPIRFKEWLIPFKPVLDALQFNRSDLDNGQIELRSFASVMRLDPKQLSNDPELGRVLSITQIETLLGVPCEFNINEYAVVFNPPWIGAEFKQKYYYSKRPPINFEGLPVINSPYFTLTALGQQITMTGNSNENNYLGDLTAVGTILNGSWYTQIEQTDIQDTNTWRLEEIQYLQLTPETDWVIGNHNTFWPGRGGNQFFGITTVKRWGFNAPVTHLSLGTSFDPRQQLQSNRIERTIAGKAEPGTLVQLVTPRGNLVIAEVLVDSTGIYRFENVSSSETSLTGITGSNDRYQVYLYPNGQLTATPEIREASYLSLAGQLSTGTSALIASLGLEQQYANEQFFGKLEGLNGGLLYRWGATDNLTLGVGAAYDNALTYGLLDIFYQPANIPLRLNASIAYGTEETTYDAHIEYTPNPTLRLALDSDEFSQRAYVTWQVYPGTHLYSNWNSQENTIGYGIGIGGTYNDMPMYADASIDGKGNFRWSTRLRRQNLEFNHRQNETGSNTSLEYLLPKKGMSRYANTRSIRLTHDRADSGDDMTILSWRDTSVSRTADRLSAWQYELGYGQGTRGRGFIASASSALLPGLYLSGSLNNISENSDELTFNVSLSLDIYTHPQLAPGSAEAGRLRQEGGIYLQAFYDKNSNGQRDSGEDVYTDDDIESLFLINTRPIKQFAYLDPNLRGEGAFFRLAPATYRLDIDPGGAPIGWKAELRPQAIEVVAGSFTTVKVPLTPSYIIAGRVTDLANKPVAGAKIEMLPIKGKKLGRTSLTNRAGIYYLEDLQQGKYRFKINDRAVKKTLTLDQNSESLVEMDFQIEVK
ncbi:hypothetical protein PN36_32630 [Candidatus Thiomargarita nelsonii]|uniref:SD-repeat containing protein B domain-containing protein n=1 Tax=Candidatus Thiomargarita nelsonii TaxID=1003181 RepID=A0A4E0RLI8_9GAMM|nr:hypothetical protein PN36_32630 [Candidatus Thiomargarita nelsonii]